MAEIEKEVEEKEEPKVIPGVIYISTLPKGMGPVHLRQILSQFGEIDRIYCAANYQRKRALTDTKKTISKKAGSSSRKRNTQKRR
ncbi:Oidioi.mRNA.OKI2018_I69.chr2.g5224.t1.cds [Oikopleura dioica]|uniref:Oidioi.mRNA.OKI2018_I69.chr2.g5224.t1.cds n=1 Tax=Oikopleura dioica TaxID=34765 RepID=A0ABN7T6A9_OIKDI|nr:Oidioi.mRNA.OKI2018_I69.chr2.g5224.t1.cds [Oikopleura dioica]